MGEHKHKKLRGDTVCTADEYRKTAGPKPPKMSKRQTELMARLMTLQMLTGALNGGKNYAD